MSSQREQLERIDKLALIEKRWQNCTRCALHEERRCVVNWRGSTIARLAVIGEAPGVKEDAKGQPFVGRAGALFDELCSKIVPVGPEPWSYFIANVIGCRPPRNRKPKLDEWQQCYPRIFAMLAVVQPVFVLMLGATALEFLTGWRSVSKRRGEDLRIEFEWHRRQLVFPARVTYHPAFLLRNPSAQREALADIRVAWERAQPASWLEGD